MPEGKLSWNLAWKVCAFVPMLLLCAAMIVRVAGDQSDADTPEAVTGEDTSAVYSSPTGPAPVLTKADRSKKRQAAKSSESPTSDPSTTAPTESGPSPKPSKSPSPTKEPSPSPTPTPEEARERCLEEGNNPADLGALAECIADKMGG
jgi:outer membrane biosynthesis protein TonB